MTRMYDNCGSENSEELVVKYDSVNTDKSL